MEDVGKCDKKHYVFVEDVQKTFRRRCVFVEDVDLSLEKEIFLFFLLESTSSRQTQRLLNVF